MPKILESRSAQYPLVQDYVFSFGDTAVSTTGAAIDFKSVAVVATWMFNLPPGAVVRGGAISVETAYVGPTAATLSVGDTTSATRYASAVNLLASARTALTLPVASVDGLDVSGTLTLTVAAATAGKVRVQIEYTIDGRGNEIQSH